MNSIVPKTGSVTVLQLPKFKTEATELIGADGIAAVAIYLSDHLDVGDVTQGARERGGGRIIYLYVVIAARICLLRCYAKSVRPDLTPDERKELRRIAADLKGVA